MNEDEISVGMHVMLFRIGGHARELATVVEVTRLPDGFVQRLRLREERNGHFVAFTCNAASRKWSSKARRHWGLSFDAEEALALKK